MLRSRTEKLSKLLSNSLDAFGYSEYEVSGRIEYMNKCSEAKTIFTQKILKKKEIEKVIVGSKREGVSLEGESDRDILQIDNSKRCLEYLDNITCDSSKTVFHIERKGAPNGYCYLRLVGTCQKNVKFAISRNKNKCYLSSTKYVERNEDVYKNNKGCIGVNTVYKGTRGPALQKSCNVFGYYFSELDPFCNYESDIVKAFPCISASIIKTWCNRIRKHDWPSVSMIKHVETLQAHVVPVGKKWDPKSNLQWRISFTMAEVYLIQQLNDTQTKLYVLLRWIAKHFLTPVCEDITSYIVKNTVLWLAEKHDTNHFRNEKLLDCLEDALRFLKRCIQKKALKNYMIPSRNLFDGKLTGDNVLFVTQSLDYLLNDGVNIVYIFYKKDGKLKNRLAFELLYLYGRSLVNQFKYDRDSFLSVEQITFVSERYFYCTSTYQLIVFSNLYRLLLLPRKCMYVMLWMCNPIKYVFHSPQDIENVLSIENDDIDQRSSKQIHMDEAIATAISIKANRKILSGGSPLVLVTDKRIISVDCDKLNCIFLLLATLQFTSLYFRIGLLQFLLNIAYYILFLCFANFLDMFLSDMKQRKLYVRIFLWSFVFFYIFLLIVCNVRVFIT